MTDCKVGAPKLKRRVPKGWPHRAGHPFGRCSITYLEIQPQCDLNLPVGSYAHSVRHGLVKPAEDSTVARRTRSKCRSRHDAAAAIVRVDGGWGILEIWMVEDIVELRTKGNFFDRVTSACTSFGPCSAPRCRLPNVPGAGVAKAAGFKNPFGRNGFTPGMRSGRRTFLELPPPGVLITAWVVPVPTGDEDVHAEPPHWGELKTTPVMLSTYTTSGRTMRTSIGNPERAPTIVPTCQLPKAASRNPPALDIKCLFFPNGKSYNALRLNACRTSNALNPRSYS